MTRIPHNVARQAQVLGLLIALVAVPVTAKAQDLSSQEVERILRERPALLNEEGEPIERGLDPASYVPNELIVRFQSGALTLPPGQYRTAPAEVAARAEITTLLSNTEVTEVRKVFRSFRASDTLQVLRSGEPVRVPDLSQVFVLEYETPVDVPALIAQFEALPEVLYAEPNHLYEFSVESSEAVPLSRVHPAAGSPVLLSPNDPRYGQQWALEQSNDEDIDAETAWNYETGAYGVKIGIVDSGINYNHEDLGAAYGSGYKVVGGYDWWSEDSDPMDENSHGSHVAGIAGALTNNYSSSGQREGIAGVAGGWGYDRQTGSGNKGAQLFALKIGGAGPSVDAEAGAAAIVEGSDPDGDGWGYGIDVLNNSWGGTGSQFYNETVRSALNYAARMGSVVTAAKGNEDSGTINYPSDYDGSWVISVGATNEAGERARPLDCGWPSGRGSNYGHGIDVVAPGTCILSTVLGQGYGDKSGTSMATPHVSGLAALLISEAQSKGLTLHPEDVQGIIRASADDKGAPGYDDQFGAGRINAGRALEMLQAPWNLRQTFATGGSVTSSTGTYALAFYNSGGGLSPGLYVVKRHEVRKTSFFSLDYTGTPHVWCRGANESVGWSAASPNYQTGFCEVLSNTANSVNLRTYVYEVWTGGGTYLGYYPTTPQNVRLEYTALGQVAPLSVSISGPSSVAGGEDGTWTANRSGGTAPYSYLWEYQYPCPDPDPDPPPCNPDKFGNCTEGGGGTVIPMGPECDVWSPAGTTVAITRSFSSTWGSVELKVSVTDADGTTGDWRLISVSGNRSAGGDLTSSGTDGARGADERGTSEAGTAAHAGTSLPSDPELRGAVPNPFHGEAAIAFALPEAAEVRLVVYDLLGREVAVLVEGRVEAGHHRVRFDGSGLPSGVYVVRMAAGDYVEAARMTLLR